MDHEGIDNDGDGLINEDGTGGYDGNRDWGFNWEPNLCPERSQINIHFHFLRIRQ